MTKTLLLLLIMVLAVPAWSAVPDPVDGSPVRGLWWNPDRPGQGLDIHRSPTGEYTVIWYGHDAAGQPLWLLGSGTLAADRLALDLKRFSWTQGEAQGEVVGTLQLTFPAPGAAELDWQLAGQTRQETMEPFLFALGVPERTLSGLWADVQQPGWGLSLATQGPWTVALLYYYDAAGAPRWVIGQTDRQDASVPLWRMDPPAPDRRVTGVSVADLELEVEGAAQASVRLDWPDWPLDHVVSRLTAPLYPPPSQTGAADLALAGVNVLAMDRNVVQSDQVVMVVDGRIHTLEPAATAVIPQGMTLLPGSGHWLMPGLVDSHVHIVLGPDIENDLFTILANGVTTVRQMWGTAGTIQVRDDIDQGRVVGPRILSASPGIEGPQSYWPQTIIVTNPTEARAAVSSAAADGFDFIKVYTRLSLANYQAIVDEAQQVGIPVVGHVSGQVGLDNALGGHLSIEHLAAYASEVTASGIANWNASLSAPLVQEVAGRTAAAGVWNCPTQTVVARSTGDIGRIRNSRDWRVLSPAYRSWLENPLTQPGSGLSGTAMENRGALIRALWQAGAGLVTGTDSGVRYVIPGPSLREELAWFRAAGIPAFESLQAATFNAAQMMGREGQFGVVAAGAGADLILLADDPRADLGVLERPLLVMSRGQWWTRAAIDARLDEIEAGYR